MSSRSVPVPLLMGFHCHQPVGNFDSVLRRACAECYGPLLEELERAPSFAFSLHFSGNLLEWMEAQERGVFELVRGLARRGQAELLTAGFYEPILAAIPRADALGQVRLFSRYLEELSGTAPRGLWLTERIWDPLLVGLLREAGVDYALVDDNHLRSSPHPPDRLGGYFHTETEGERLALFPISRRLRYLIPFHPVEEVVEALASLPPGQAAVIFDDGEKFGLWPGTREWVHEKGWLRGFLRAASDRAGVLPMTFSSFLASRPPLGRAVVPPGSYREMEEWALSPEDAARFRELAEGLEAEGRGELARRFLRGGAWPNFLLRYPESGHLQRRMLAASRRLSGWDLPRARRQLYRGQCNDAYWHGVFGGLYLPVLRNGVARALNEAERELDRSLGLPPPELADLDGDGHPEALVRTPEALLLVSGGAGGQAADLSDKGSLYNLFGALARRFESYHREPPAPPHTPPAAGTGGERASTIHESDPVLDPAMRRELAYDWYPRHSFVDHILPPFSPGEGLEGFSRCAHPEWGDFVDQPYQLALEAGGIRARREGGVYRPGSDPVPLVLAKEYLLAGRALRVAYRVERPAGGGGEALSALLGVELNLHLPSGEAAGMDVGGCPLPLSRPVEGEGREAVFRDPALPRPLALSLLGGGPDAPRVWSFPVRTVSRSEAGFDLTYQATSVTFLVPLLLAPGEGTSFTLTFAF